MLLPFCPPQRPDLPAPRLPGGYSLSVENFRVEELPIYAPCGSGEHLFVEVQKRGLSTMFVVGQLAKALGLAGRDIGYAGLKDRHATTTQWLSLPGVDPEQLRQVAIEGLEVLRAERHTNKLKLGHLRGNRFTIDLPRPITAQKADGRTEPSPGTAPDPVLRDLAANLADLARRGVPNFVGAQRFGSGGRNLDKGLRMLRGNPHRAARRMAKPLLRLMLSAVQSDVFNRVLAVRLATFDRIEAGDIAWLHHNGACFHVVDALAELPRCERFEISPTGPLPGPKCLAPLGPIAAIEAEACAELELDPLLFAKYRSNPGERRSLRTRMTAAAVSTPSPQSLRVQFELDRGSFATTVLRELVDAPEWIVVDEDSAAEPLDELA